MSKIGCGMVIEPKLRNRSRKKCGDYGVQGKMLCPECMRNAEERYPQGWSYYPGDVCKHGVYTGGCGIDYMCGKCEMGEE